MTIWNATVTFLGYLFMLLMGTGIVISIIMWIDDRKTKKKEMLFREIREMTEAQIKRYHNDTLTIIEHVNKETRLDIELLKQNVRTLYARPTNSVVVEPPKATRKPKGEK